jgi:hypothetical protein
MIYLIIRLKLILKTIIIACFLNRKVAEYIFILFLIYIYISIYASASRAKSISTGSTPKSIFGKMRFFILRRVVTMIHHTPYAIGKARDWSPTSRCNCNAQGCIKTEVRLTLHLRLHLLSIYSPNQSASACSSSPSRKITFPES